MSRSVLVAGFGVTGRSVARYLLLAGDRVVVVDDAPTPEAREAARHMGLALGPTPDPAELIAMVSDVDLIVTSPGLAVGHPIFRAGAQSGVPVWSEIELAFEAAAQRGGPAIAAITGTNGKTTVTTTVAAILEASGIKAVAAGNIGLPLVDAVALDVSVVVAEVSSFQLHFTHRFRPAVSCWLNLAEDHLDWHPDLGHYRSAKARIWAHQRVGDTAVVNADDDVVVASASSIPDGVAVLRYSTQAPADFGLDGGRLLGPRGELLITVDELPRSFPHDVSNALAAAAVSMALGATPAGCRAGLESVALLPHRVSLIAEDGGVSWYDDSKATTPASVLAAVAGFSSVVLIAGGRNKGLDLGVLGATAPPVRAVVAIGEAAPEIEAALAERVEVARAATMTDAVEQARRMARPGDAVLLSPGCASFDWYRSYAERGDDFTRIVKQTVSTKGEPC